MLGSAAGPRTLTTQLLPGPLPVDVVGAATIRI
jgi:hypothetical protein